jgi:predicted DNA-binding protein (MmcQ/YjbR family)
MAAIDKNSSSLKAVASPAEAAAIARVRRTCLSLPNTTERQSWGHPNFCVGKKVFVAIEWIKGRPSIAFRLSEHRVAALLENPEFFATPYGRGRWVSIYIGSRLKWPQVRALVHESYECP